MQVSYSLHLSKGSHALTTINKIAQADRHNLRKYKSDEYDRSKIEVLAGSDRSILDSVKETYEIFEPARKKYNEGKRSGRQIKNYMQHISDSRADVAAELIIQIGDKDFWVGKTDEEKRQMYYIFEDQVRSLQKLRPDFKISSAVVHYDESSPHMHVIGVPVATGYKKGMEIQCAKTKVFTKDTLSYLQDKMRKNAEKGMNLPTNQNLFADVTLKPKEKGRNKDIPKKSLDEYYKILKETEKLQAESERLAQKAQQARENMQQAQECLARAENKTAQQIAQQQIAQKKAAELEEKAAKARKDAEQAEIELKKQTEALAANKAAWLDAPKKRRFGSKKIEVTAEQMVQIEYYTQHMLQKNSQIYKLEAEIREKDKTIAQEKSSRKAAQKHRDELVEYLKNIKTRDGKDLYTCFLEQAYYKAHGYQQQQDKNKGDLDR